MSGATRNQVVSADTAMSFIKDFMDSNDTGKPQTRASTSIVESSEHERAVPAIKEPDYHSLGTILKVPTEHRMAVFVNSHLPLNCADMTLSQHKCTFVFYVDSRDTVRSLINKARLYHATAHHVSTQLSAQEAAENKCDCPSPFCSIRAKASQAARCKIITDSERILFVNHRTGVIMLPAVNAEPPYAGDTWHALSAQKLAMPSEDGAFDVSIGALIDARHIAESDMSPQTRLQRYIESNHKSSMCVSKAKKALAVLNKSARDARCTCTDDVADALEKSFDSASLCEEIATLDSDTDTDDDYDSDEYEYESDYSYESDDDSEPSNTSPHCLVHNTRARNDLGKMLDHFTKLVRCRKKSTCQCISHYMLRDGGVSRVVELDTVFRGDDCAYSAAGDHVFDMNARIVRDLYSGLRSRGSAEPMRKSIPEFAVQQRILEHAATHAPNHCSPSYTYAETLAYALRVHAESTPDATTLCQIIVDSGAFKKSKKILRRALAWLPQFANAVLRPYCSVDEGISVLAECAHNIRTNLGDVTPTNNVLFGNGDLENVIYDDLKRDSNTRRVIARCVSLSTTQPTDTAEFHNAAVFSATIVLMLDFIARMNSRMRAEEKNIEKAAREDIARAERARRAEAKAQATKDRKAAKALQAAKRERSRVNQRLRRARADAKAKAEAELAAKALAERAASLSTPSPETTPRDEAYDFIVQKWGTYV